MTADSVIFVAMVVAIVILVWLWRLGPEHRLAFFLVGIGIGVGFIVVGTFQDDVEEYIDDVSTDVIESIEEALATTPPEIVDVIPRRPRTSPSALQPPEGFEPSQRFRPRGAFDPSPPSYPSHISVGGVSLVLPAGWRTRTPAQVGDPWLFPDEYETLSWEPLLIASGDGGSCALIDASEYADELLFWALGDALEFELDGYAEEPAYYPLTYLSNAMSGVTGASVAGEMLNLRSGPAAVIDVTLAGADPQRHYLLSNAAAWHYLICGAPEPPPDRWLSIAESVTWLGGSPAAPARPPATPEPTATPLPTLSPRGVELQSLVPFSECGPRDPRTGQHAVIDCDTDDASVTYISFTDLEALHEWWPRQFGAADTVAGVIAAERCQAGQAAESAWFHEPGGGTGGRYACRPAQSVVLPSVTWTDESQLLAGRATSGAAQLPELYRRWTEGDFTPGGPQPVTEGSP